MSYLEYPKMLHHPKTGDEVIVSGAQEEEALLKTWGVEAVSTETPTPEEETEPEEEESDGGSEGASTGRKAKKKK